MDLYQGLLFCRFARPLTSNSRRENSLLLSQAARRHTGLAAKSPDFTAAVEAGNKRIDRIAEYQ